MEQDTVVGSVSQYMCMSFCTKQR